MITKPDFDNNKGWSDDAQVKLLPELKEPRLFINGKRIRIHQIYLYDHTCPRFTDVHGDVYDVPPSAKSSWTKDANDVRELHIETARYGCQWVGNDNV